MAIILPGLANSTARSDRVACVNNLRQIGVAYANFGLERGDLTPWRVPMNQGGNFDYPFKHSLYVQFAALSNGLATPRLLADPGDQRPNLNPAQHWGTSPGGLWHLAHRNNSVSYFLGLHGDLRTPREVLAGDRNLLAAGSGTCSSGILPVTVLDRRTARWTNAVHGLSGNLLFYDGAVKQVDSVGLREAVFTGRPDDGAGSNGSATHILLDYW